jgi:hypothetical protein
LDVEGDAAVADAGADAEAEAAAGADAAAGAVADAGADADAGAAADAPATPVDLSLCHDGPPARTLPSVLRPTTTAAALVWLLAACAQPAPIDGARCDLERACPDGYSCLAEQCRKLPGGPKGCRSDDDCPVGVCLPGAGFCVQCADPDDCVNGTCLTDVLQCGCRVAGDCASGRCHAETSTCLPCFSDRQCEAGWWCEVDEGTCKKIDGPKPKAEGTPGTPSEAPG